jgi:hypothetical protein
VQSAKVNSHTLEFAIRRSRHFHDLLNAVLLRVPALKETVSFLAGKLRVRVTSKLSKKMAHKL